MQVKLTDFQGSNAHVEVAAGAFHQGQIVTVSQMTSFSAKVMSVPEHDTGAMELKPVSGDFNVKVDVS